MPRAGTSGFGRRPTDLRRPRSTIADPITTDIRHGMPVAPTVGAVPVAWSGSRSPLPSEDGGVGGPLPGPSTSYPDGEVPIPDLEIPHPLETLSRRPRRHPPKWVPSPVPGGGRSIPRSILEGWHSPRIVADANAGAVSIDFKYCHAGGASAVFSEKSVRQQFMSGPHEKARWRMLESAARIVDFQFQPFTIVWKTAAGGERRYTPDSLELDREGNLTAREEKADPAYHAEPETADLLERAEAFLITKGVRFERSCGQPDPMAWRAQKDVTDARRFEFSNADLHAVSAELASGASNAGRLVDAIGGDREIAAAKLRAMTARGVVDIGTERPWTRSTAARPVREPVSPYRLREFLREHACGPEGRRAS